ncbi:MAG: hypothetical protein AAGA99_01870 [Actinomycetota bacterium]
MDDQEWTVYEWQLAPSTAQLRTVQLLLLALVGTAVIVAGGALLGSTQLRVYAIPAALLAAAGVIWQQRSGSLDYRLAVNSRRDLIIGDGRGRREIVPLEGAEVSLRRRSQGGFRFGTAWRWAVEIRTAAGKVGVHELPAFAGCFNPDEAEAQAVVTELTQAAGAHGARQKPPRAAEFPEAPRGRDRSRFEWRHPRLAEIARIRRRIRFAFGVGVVAVAVATAIAVWGDDLSAIPPAVGIGVGVVLLAMAAAVDWIFRMPFRWVLRVNPDGVLRVTTGSRHRDVRLTGAKDVVVGKRRPEVADGEIGTNGSHWAVAVVRPEGKHFEATIPSVGGWADLRPDDAKALERVLRRRAGLPVRQG